MLGDSLDSVLTADDVDVTVESLLAKLKLPDAARENDDSELTTLDKQFKSLQITLDAVQRRLQDHITQSVRKRNGLVLFHRLPAELLVAIFQTALADETNDYYPRLSDISGVRTAWRAIVMESPVFWTIINQSDPPALIKAALERSGSYPLDIYAQGDRSYSKIFKQLGPEQHRIRFLQCIAIDDGALLRSFAESPNPTLEHLQLAYSGNEFDMADGLKLFSGHAPRLRHISLDSISIRWDSAILFTLKSLKICNLRNGGLSGRRLLSILSQATNLECLNLNEVTFSEEAPHPTSSNMSPISLPHLTQLDLSLSPVDMFMVVENIRVTACRTIRLCCHTWHDSTFEMPVTSILRLGSSIPDITAVRGLGVELKLSEDSLEWIIEYSGRTSEGLEFRSGVFDVYLSDKNPQNPLQTVQWLAETLPRLDSPPVEVLFWYHNPFNYPEIFRLLDQMKVVSLKFEGKGKIDPMIAYLSGTTMGGKGSRRFNFPKLPALHIHISFDDEALMEMLRSRYGSAVKSQAPDLPLQLKILTFRRRAVKPTTFENVVEVLGAGIVQCSNRNPNMFRDDDPGEAEVEGSEATINEHRAA